MKPHLTFIIPVRHQENTTNWGALKKRLSETVASIARQDCDGWKAIIVANHEADLPDLPLGFDVKRVDFPPNPDLTIHANRMVDKGRRCLAGIFHADEIGHVMFVDDDDLVNRHLVSFVRSHPQANGWYFNKGYLWSENSNILYLAPKFYELSGTSHIIRTDLLNLPETLESASENYLKRYIGEHFYYYDDFKKAGTPLSPLPFIGAIYRVGHINSVSGTKSILYKYLFSLDNLIKPWKLAYRITRFRYRNKKIRDDFFGNSKV